MNKKNCEIFNELLLIMEKLRGENGCPWDKKQNYKSLTKYVLEEAYELVDAIERDDFSSLKDELGDLLLQVVFLSHIAKEEGKFDIFDVINSLNKKLIRRHPHVFSDTKAIDEKEVRKNWEIIKEKIEKKNKSLDFIHLPSLIEAFKLGEIAGDYNFDWENSKDILKKLKEEVNELEEALKSNNKKNIKEEIGDIFFTLSQLSRKENINPEIASKYANNKFKKRFKNLIKKIKGDKNLKIEELDKEWEKIKREEL